MEEARQLQTAQRHAAAAKTREEALRAAVVWARAVAAMVAWVLGAIALSVMMGVEAGEATMEAEALVLLAREVLGAPATPRAPSPPIRRGQTAVTAM